MSYPMRMRAPNSVVQINPRLPRPHRLFLEAMARPPMYLAPIRYWRPVPRQKTVDSVQLKRLELELERPQLEEEKSPQPVPGTSQPKPPAPPVHPARMGRKFCASGIGFEDPESDDITVAVTVTVREVTKSKKF